MANAHPRFHLLVLILGGLMVTLPGMTQMPPLDRDEARFAQATVQMLETGDFLRIRFQDEARNKKPAGIYWLQAASVKAFSSPDARAIWAYRLPSMVGILLAMAGIWLLGRQFYDSAGGLGAALMFGAAPVVMGEATIAKTDAMLTGLVVLMMAGLARTLFPGAQPSTAEPAIPRRGTSALFRLGDPVLFWGAMAAAILIKGPIAPMVAGLTIVTLLALRRGGQVDALGTIRFSRLRPVMGAIILFTALAPWAWAIHQATDGRFFADAIGRDFLGKVTSAQESHVGLPGYHLILLPILFWPACVLLPGMLASGFSFLRAREKRLAAPRLPFIFWLSWIIPAWIIFELSNTKLPHYTLPLYPALALLAAGVLRSPVPARTPDRPSPWPVLCGGALSGTIALGFAGAMPVLQAIYRTGGIEPWIWLPAVLVAGCGVLTVLAALSWNLRTALLASGIGAWLAGTALLTAVLPSLDRLGVSTALAQSLARLGHVPAIGEPGNRPVLVLGYREPSTVFLLGTQTVLADHVDQLIAGLVADEQTIAILDETHKPDFLSRAYVEDLSLYEVAKISGFNYSKGDPVTLTVFQQARPFP